MLTRLIRFNFSEILRAYEKIYPKLDQMKYSDVIKVYWNLKKNNQLSEQMWEKCESMFMKHISRLSPDDLIKTSRLLKNQTLNKKFQLQFEYKVQRSIGQFQQNELIKLSHLFANDKLSLKFKRILFQNILIEPNLYSTMDLLKYTANLIQSKIPDNYKTTKDIQQIYDNINPNELDPRGLTLYLNIFHTDELPKFYENQKEKMKTMEDMQQILSGQIREHKEIQTINQHRSLDDIAARVNLFLENRQTFAELTLVIQALKTNVSGIIDQNLIKLVVEKNFMNLSLQEFSSVVQTLLILRDENLQQKLKELSSQYLQQFLSKFSDHDIAYLLCVDYIKNNEEFVEILLKQLNEIFQNQRLSLNKLNKFQKVIFQIPSSPNYSEIVNSLKERFNTNFIYQMQHNRNFNQIESLSALSFVQLNSDDKIKSYQDQLFKLIEPKSPEDVKQLLLRSNREPQQVAEMIRKHLQDKFPI